MGLFCVFVYFFIQARCVLCVSHPFFAFIIISIDHYHLANIIR